MSPHADTPPAPPAPAKAYTETAVTFQGPEGLPLAGILCEPSTSAAAEHSPTPTATQQQKEAQHTTTFSPHQCAVLCHGFASHKNAFHLPAIAHHLAQQLGMSSLRFDYTGNMDSPGPFRFGGFMQEVAQMAAAKAFLEQQHDKQVVLLLGHSRGAINATLYSGQACAACTAANQHQQQGTAELQPAQQQQQQQQQQSHDDQHQTASAQTPPASPGIVPLVVLVAGRYDLTINMHQRYGPDVQQQLQESGPWQQRTKRDGDGHEIHWQLTAEEMAERFSLDVAGACDSISKSPEAQRPQVLVLHGQADPICEASDVENLASHIAGSQLVVGEGADHWWKDMQQQLLDAVTTFVVAAGRQKGLC